MLALLLLKYHRVELKCENLFFRIEKSSSSRSWRMVREREPFLRALLRELAMKKVVKKRQEEVEEYKKWNSRIAHDCSISSCVHEHTLIDSHSK